MSRGKTSALRKPSGRKEPPRLIGLTGTNGAGKGEVADFLARKGYARFSLSDEIREELQKKGKEVTRDSLIVEGNALRRRFGADILARRVMRKVRGKAVIDSVRNLREAAFLRKQKGFLLVAVDAPAELRYKRVRRRGRAESASTLEEFVAKENEEIRGSAGEQQLGRVMSKADITVINDGTRAALRRKIEAIL